MSLLEMLYEATHSSHGIVIRSSNRDRLLHKLYALKRDNAPDFELLDFKNSPISSLELWVVKRSPDAPDS